MSKYMTKKGLAFGAGIALVASGLAAAPAQADTTGPVTLVPDTGSTFNSILQSGFTLKTELDGNEFSVEEAASLAFLVENPGAAAISLDLATAGALNEQVNFRSDTDWAATGISPAATKGARLNGEATTAAADDDLWAAATYASDNAKFAYVTGSSDQTVATYAGAIAAGTAEAHVFDEVVGTDIDGALLITLTLANGAVLTFTPDGSPTSAEIQAGLRLDGDYDANYAIVTAGAGATGSDDGGSDLDTFDFTVTYAKIQGNVALSTLNAFGAAQTIDTNTPGAPAGFNFGTSVKKNTLTIATTETVKNVTLYVTAFLDENGNGVKDTFESASDRETVVLYAPGNVAATTTIDYLKSNDSSYRTTIVYNNSINPFQVAAKTYGKLFVGGTLVDVTVAEADAADNDADDLTVAAISTATTALGGGDTIGITKNTLSVGVTSAGVSNAFNMNAANNDVVDMVAGTYTAQTYYFDGANYLAVGSASAAFDMNVGVNADVDTLEPTVTESASLDFAAGDNTTSTLGVKTGTKSFVVAVQARDANGAVGGGVLDLEKSAIKVRATVTAVTLGSGAVSVTGSSTSLAEDDVTVGYAFTNSKGVASFTITNTVGSEDDVVTAKFEILKSDGTYVDADTLTATWADAALASWSSVGGAYVSGETVNLSFKAVDQFGGVISADDAAALSVVAVASVGGISKPATYSKTVSVTDGVASFSFANFATAGASAQLVATLNAGTSAATPSGGGSATITVNVYNSNATSSLNVADSFSTAINYADNVTGALTDTAVTAAATASGIATAASVAITGNVLDVNGVGQPGAAVVLKADGVLFRDASNYALGEITTYANEYGAFSVTVFAHMVNTTGATVSITSGTVSDSTLLKTYLPTSINDENLAFSWNMPAELVKNTTYAVVATLTDKWGNPIPAKDLQGDGNAVDFAVAFTGTGSIEINGVGTTVYREFNTKGQSTVFVRSIKDIAGPGAVSATLGGNAGYATGNGTATSSLGTVDSANTVNDTATVWDETLWAGTLSAELDVKDVASVVAADQKVNVGSFKGYVALYAKGYKGQKMTAIVAGKWIKVDSLASDFERVVRYTGAGYSITTKIYIDGVQIGDAFTTMTK